MYLAFGFGWPDSCKLNGNPKTATMMSQHLTSMFEQLGNFTKNNLTHNSKLVKEKENKASSNHVGVGGGGGGNQASPSPKHGLPAPLKKPYKLRNVASKAESYDTLYANGTMVSASINL